MRVHNRILILLLLALPLFSSCDNESMPDCFKQAGDIVTYEVAVADFSSVTISEGIELIISEGLQQRVVVETGENLQDEIAVQVNSDELVLRNNTSCNWVRDYNITKVYVTTPSLYKVYSSSQFAVKSDGALTFPDLTLQSGMFGETASGSFELQVDCGSLVVEDNQNIYCNISGRVDNLTIGFYAGDARFEGAALVAQNVTVFQRSSNDIIVNPQQQIKGTIYSTGNLILVNKPPVVEVDQLYKGSLQFR